MLSSLSQHPSATVSHLETVYTKNTTSLLCQIAMFPCQMESTLTLTCPAKTTQPALCSANTGRKSDCFGAGRLNGCRTVKQSRQNNTCSHMTIDVNQGCYQQQGDILRECYCTVPPSVGPIHLESIDTINIGCHLASIVIWQVPIPRKSIETFETDHMVLMTCWRGRQRVTRLACVFQIKAWNGGSCRMRAHLTALQPMIYGNL